MVVPLERRISDPLRDAERAIGLSLARMGAIGPGGRNAWVGAWQEYKKLAQLMLKTRALADKIQRMETGIHVRRRKPCFTKRKL